MYQGDTQTIAEKGISPSEATDAIKMMAREAIGTKDALWSAIHEDRRHSFRRMQWIAGIALAALALSICQLACVLLR